MGQTNRETYIYNGMEYCVAEKALHDINLIPTRTVDFNINYMPLLLYEIFKREQIKPKHMCVSLAISEFGKKESIVKEKCSKFMVNEEVFEQDVYVFPQGIGIWLQNHSPANAVIIDVGFNTTDVLIVKDSEPKKNLSTGFTDLGVCLIADVIRSRIREDFAGADIGELEANEILQKKKIKLFRKELDFTDIIEREKKNYARQILQVVLSSTRVKSFINKTDAFIVAGGGAYFIDKETCQNYGFTIPEKPEFANVKGFLSMMQGDIETGGKEE
jgi:plasmid segregation protein ParM